MTYAIETTALVKRFLRQRRYREILRHPFRRDRTVALDGVDLAVPQGELFALLGPNGAGKTTLIRILCTLVLPTSGVARVAGHDVTRQGAAIRARIGYAISEERSFYWRLTGRQNLAFFAALNNLTLREAKARIAEVGRLAELDEFIDRQFMAYSAGMKQRLAIARALLTRPDILFLDEPTRALDPVAARTLREFLKRTLVGENGTTIFLATHNLVEAEELADRVAVLDHGHVLACGRIGELRREWGARATHALRLRAQPEAVRAALESAPGRPRLLSLEQDPSAEGRLLARIELHNGAANVSDVIRCMVLADVAVESAWAEEPNLEDIFSQLVKP